MYELMHEELHLPKIQTDWHSLAQISVKLRPLVCTNGVFDIIHRGHIHLLQEAKKLGNYLVVALNTDASVLRLNKGHNRPIQSQEDRAAIMASFMFVDFVTFFDELTPLQFIHALKPDVLVKGGDYAIDQIVGAHYVSAMGGKVISIPFQYARSTTQIVNRIGLESTLHSS